MTLRPVIAALLLALPLVACSTEGEMRAVDPAGAGDASAATPSEAPTPVPDGEVRTSGLVTVLDPGTGPQMCLGAVAESYPPQCSGPAIEGFEWGEVGFEEASGVTWGQYALTGTFDATTDTEKATPEDLDATLAAAAALPGYATAWLTGNTINVAVTEDAAGAETTLRETWGGPLCVTTVERTDADLNAINQELQAALPTLLTSGSFAPDTLDAQVVFDDGSIQEWVDATYGEGLVRVSSALTPVE